MNTKIMATVAIAVMFCGIAGAMLANSADGEDPYYITDDTGEVFEFTQPTEHIVTMGSGSTLTVAILGQLEKIIAVDAYSTYSYTGDNRLKDMDAKDMGSIYTSSNNDYIVSTFLQWEESKKMNFDDAIILTSYSNAKILKGLLENAGFTKVLYYNTITNYDQIVDFVYDMSIVVTGGNSKVVDDMKLVSKTVSEGLEEVTEEAKGLCAWYSPTSGLGILNKNSIAVSLMEAAGGTNIGYKSDAGNTYGSDSTITTLMENNKDAVIFLSNSYLRSHTVTDFRNEVLGGDRDIKIVPLDLRWNNYCPDAAEGLWTIASALYPDIFDGDVPTTDDDSSSNLVLYAVAGVIVVIAIVAVAYFVMRKP